MERKLNNCKWHKWKLERKLNNCKSWSTRKRGTKHSAAGQKGSKKENWSNKEYERIANHGEEEKKEQNRVEENPHMEL